MHPGARSPGARHGPQASRGTVPGCEAWSSCIPGHGPRVRGMVLKHPGARSPGARHGPHASRGTVPGCEAWSSCIPGHGPKVRGMVFMHPGARSPGARHGPLGRVPVCILGARSPGARHGLHASRGTVPGCEAWSSCIMHPGARSPGARHGPHASRGTVPGCEAWSSSIPGHGPRVRGMVLWGESLRALPGHGPWVRGMVFMHPGARAPGARHGSLGRVPVCTPGAWSPGARHGPHASRGTGPGCEAWFSGASPCVHSRGMVPGCEAWSSCIPGHGPRVRGMVLMHPGARSPGARHGPLWRSLIALSVGRGPRAFVFGGSRAVGHDCKVASVRSVIATRLMHRACACIPIGSAGGVSRWSATGRAGRELRSVGRGGPACASPSLDLLPPHRYDFHF